LSSVPSNTLSACVEKSDRCYKCNPERGSQCSNDWLWIYDFNLEDSYWWNEVSCEETSPCPDGVAASNFLQKNSAFDDDEQVQEDVSYYNWENTKFYYDALGRKTQNDPNTRRYLFAPPKNKLTYGDRKTSEFEVFENTVKDSYGNDVRVFVSEDKAKGLRKDSSYYSNGSWDVMEKDDSTRTIKSETSQGVKIERKHDENWRLTNKIIIKNNDTIVSDKYYWENGRLIKTIIAGVERKYIYGKTLQDTVKVIPSDENIEFHPGFNNSVGIMIDESNPMYKYFVLDPYGNVFASYKEGKPNSYSRKSVSPILRKSVNPQSECGITEKPGMPSAICTRFEETDIPIGYDKDFYYPGELFPIYGKSSFGFNLTNFECKCESDGFFHASQNGSLIVDEYIEVYFSAWKYKLLDDYWEERCWSKEGIQETYNHEVIHVENARKVAEDRFKKHVQDKYKTENECRERSQEKIYLAYIDWLDWQYKEILHDNTDPPSPQSSWGKQEVQCIN
jgi:hypothetical protein